MRPLGFFFRDGFLIFFKPGAYIAKMFNYIFFFFSFVFFLKKINRKMINRKTIDMILFKGK